ncbi:MAG: TfoX/Sxy family protein [Caulobacteraceae bacterium]|nr:TfoX/Sxy family protein [Caulobacteraceae bacterium]
MDAAEIEEMFQGLGPVSIRRMFGGKGVYHQGLIIAVEFRDELLLKADAVSAPAFQAAGSRQWTYDGQAGKSTAMPYWSVPVDAFDDPEVMADWARLAYEAALRAAQSKAAKSKPAKSRKTRRGGDDL